MSSVEWMEAKKTHMKKKVTVFTLSALLFALSYPVSAQQPKKVPRIGYLSSQDPARESARSEPIRLALRELGYIEGQNIAIEYRYAEGKRDRYPELLAELVRLKVDIIVVPGGGRFLRAVMNATKTIPIVMAGQGVDPVASGFVASLARPGGNVTGISSLQSELAAKRLQVLHSLAPAVRRVFIVHDRRDPAAAPMVRNAIGAASALNLEVVVRAVDDDAELSRSFADVGPGDALFAADDERLRISVATLEQSLALHVPAIFTTALWVGHGGLISYGPDAYGEGVQAASLVAKIRGGTKPGDLPVEGAERIDLAVNLKTADILGLAIPRRILLRADAFRR